MLTYATCARESDGKDTLKNVKMPFKIDSAIMKLDTETGKYDLVDPDGKFNKKDALMVVESDDFITMQLVINAIIRNDFKAWKEVKWDDSDSLKAILVKLGYGREEKFQPC